MQEESKNSQSSKPEGPKPSFWAKMGKSLKTFKSREIWIAVAALLAVGVLMLLAVMSTVDRVSEDQDEQAETVTEPDRHPLTGDLLESPLESLPRVFGIMVENSAGAWPLTGLDKAFLVIEAPVEASIPRFIAFYSEESDVEKVGPIRSSRPYYLDWNDALDAVYAHVGGSPEALDLIKNVTGTIDLDQTWNGTYFYRQNQTRYAPHNVYTSMVMLLAALVDKEIEGEPAYESWSFKDDQPVIASDAESITIDFNGSYLYEIGWTYDAPTNSYERFQAGDEMLMENGASIYANNVAVIATDIRIIDSIGRKSLETLGSGDAIFSQDGETELVTWKKEERTDRIRFYKTEGEEIQFNAGTTWIEVVSDLSQVEIYHEGGK